MESLAYIAKRLEVDVSQLVNEVNVVELREVLDEAEELFNLDIEEIPDKYETLVRLIEPHISKLQQGYEAARLLDIYGQSLHRTDKEWKIPIAKASALYEEMNLAQKRANIGVFRANVRFRQHHYGEALEVLLTERSRIEKKAAYIDAMTRLELDYHEAIFYFAVGDTLSAKRVMDAAIAYSKENKTFYLIDDLYRLAGAAAMMSEDAELHDYYLAKLKQYADFSEDEGSLLSYQLFHIESLISVKRDYEAALKIINPQLEKSESVVRFKEWFLLEKGKALHGLGEYEEAIRYFDQAQLPSHHHHPFDLSQFYLKDTYKAHCYKELGDQQKALISARTAVEQFEAMPDSPYKEFSRRTYEELLGS